MSSQNIVEVKNKTKDIIKLKNGDNHNNFSNSHQQTSFYQSDENNNNNNNNAKNSYRSPKNINNKSPKNNNNKNYVSKMTVQQSIDNSNNRNSNSKSLLSKTLNKFKTMIGMNNNEEILKDIKDIKGKERIIRFIFGLVQFLCLFLDGSLGFEINEMTSKKWKSDTADFSFWIFVGISILSIVMGHFTGLQQPINKIYFKNCFFTTLASITGVFGLSPVYYFFYSAIYGKKSIEYDDFIYLIWGPRKIWCHFQSTMMCYLRCHFLYTYNGHSDWVAVGFFFSCLNILFGFIDHHDDYVQKEKQQKINANTIGKGIDLNIDESLKETTPYKQAKRFSNQLSKINNFNNNNDDYEYEEDKNIYNQYHYYCCKCLCDGNESMTQIKVGEMFKKSKQEIVNKLKYHWYKKRCSYASCKNIVNQKFNFEHNQEQEYYYKCGCEGIMNKGHMLYLCQDCHSKNHDHRIESKYRHYFNKNLNYILMIPEIFGRPLSFGALAMIYIDKSKIFDVQPIRLTYDFTFWNGICMLILLISMYMVYLCVKQDKSVRPISMMIFYVYFFTQFLKNPFSNQKVLAQYQYILITYAILKEQSEKTQFKNNQVQIQNVIQNHKKQLQLTEVTQIFEFLAEGEGIKAEKLYFIVRWYPRLIYFMGLFPAFWRFGEMIIILVLYYQNNDNPKTQQILEDSHFDTLKEFTKFFAFLSVFTQVFFLFYYYYLGRNLTYMKEQYKDSEKGKEFIQNLKAKFISDFSEGKHYFDELSGAFEENNLLNEEAIKQQLQILIQDNQGIKQLVEQQPESMRQLHQAQCTVLSQFGQINHKDSIIVNNKNSSSNNNGIINSNNEINSSRNNNNKVDKNQIGSKLNIKKMSYSSKNKNLKNKSKFGSHNYINSNNSNFENDSFEQESSSRGKLQQKNFQELGASHNIIQEQPKTPQINKQINFNNNNLVQLKQQQQQSENEENQQKQNENGGENGDIEKQQQQQDNLSKSSTFQEIDVIDRQNGEYNSSNGNLNQYNYSHHNQSTQKTLKVLQILNESIGIELQSVKKKSVCVLDTIQSLNSPEISEKLFFSGNNGIEQQQQQQQVCESQKLQHFINKTKSIKTLQQKADLSLIKEESNRQLMQQQQQPQTQTILDINTYSQQNSNTNQQYQQNGQNKFQNDNIQIHQDSTHRVDKQLVIRNENEQNNQNNIQDIQIQMHSQHGVQKSLNTNTKNIKNLMVNQTN